MEKAVFEMTQVFKVAYELLQSSLCSNKPLSAVSAFELAEDFLAEGIARGQLKINKIEEDK